MFHLDNNSGISAMPKPAVQQSSATRWFTEGAGIIPRAGLVRTGLILFRLNY